ERDDGERQQQPHRIVTDSVRVTGPVTSVTFAFRCLCRLSDRRCAAVSVTRTDAGVLNDAVRRTPATVSASRPEQATLQRRASATRPCASERSARLASVGIGRTGAGAGAAGAGAGVATAGGAATGGTNGAGAGPGISATLTSPARVRP